MPAEDLRVVSAALIKALLIREKYMNLAQHSFSATTSQFLREASDVIAPASYSDLHEPGYRQTIESLRIGSFSVFRFSTESL